MFAESKTSCDMRKILRLQNADGEFFNAIFEIDAQENLLFQNLFAPFVPKKIDKPIFMRYNNM
jgi:hypothetical protein